MVFARQGKWLFYLKVGRPVLAARTAVQGPCAADHSLARLKHVCTVHESAPGHNRSLIREPQRLGIAERPLMSRPRR